MEEIARDRQNKIDKIISVCKSQITEDIKKEANRLAEVSSNFILTSFEFPYRQVNREGPYQLLLCVSTEMLLNAIIILESPEEYVRLYDIKSQPPSFEQVKVFARNIIIKDFDEKQKERMTDILDLIQNKRNIFAHFSLSFHAYYYQHYEILNVIEYLFSHYFPSQKEVIKKIREMKERFRMKDSSDYDYVNFN
jgi:hypothetical protein